MGATRSIISLTFGSWVLIIALAAFDLVDAKAGRAECVPSSCGHIRNVSYPFRLKTDPKHCGESAYTLSCENNVTVLHLQQSPAVFYVQAINYTDKTIRVVDASIQNNNCSSIPRYSVTEFAFFDSYIYHPSRPSRPRPTLWYESIGFDECISPQNKSAVGSGHTCRGTYPIYFLKCFNPVTSSPDDMYVDTAPCFNTTSSHTDDHGYVKVDDMEAGELKEGCRIERMTFVYLNEDWDGSYAYIYKAMLSGFELTFSDDLGFNCRNQWSTHYKCFPYNFSGFFRFLWQIINDGGDSRNLRTLLTSDLRITLLIIIGLVLLVRSLFGAPIALVYVIYKWRQRHQSVYNTIEEFLHGENNFALPRYSYSDIKKMSNKFKDKVGQGGYGSVFKGKLRSGHFGAIKMLNNPKASGEEFISEVATIGRIHHVNVVQLIGYCIEGSKRALVYDFMPNGSLDKYIYSNDGSSSLSFKKMYEISLGVAQGIEYLHQGCDMQILHFDIKPHNILLDKDFIPKISDFGLAKLYPTDNSIVSLTAVRGTMGYIAPELFYKNIGGVSYKADVYSFGMLLMEMSSKRKNYSAAVEQSSQIYFPSWVYNQYSQGKDHLEMVDVTDEERIFIKKMAITALWCIQMKPSDRPSMKKVIEMLKGDVESLQMPSKPFLYPQEMPAENLQETNLHPKSSQVELTWSLSAR